MRLHPNFKPFCAFMVLNCNWQGSYSEKGVFNRCDCVPTSSFFMLLWYSIATGRYSIRKKGILIDVTAYQLQAFLYLYGIQMQLVGVLFSHFAKFVLFLCQICVSFDKSVSDPSQKGVSIATGWYSILSKMISPNKKAPGGDYPGCF